MCWRTHISVIMILDQVAGTGEVASPLCAAFFMAPHCQYYSHAILVRVDARRTRPHLPQVDPRGPSPQPPPLPATAAAAPRRRRRGGPGIRCSHGERLVMRRRCRHSPGRATRDARAPHLALVRGALRADTRRHTERRRTTFACVGRAGGRLPPFASMRQVQRSISRSCRASSAVTVTTVVVMVVMPV
jgi:hypothetical protein